ncbi:hypothetical protein CLAFUR0_13198 [Fulvia fulva]|nr:hypothetical protein CLAFUR0_13198 [Fulvia fulva]
MQRPSLAARRFYADFYRWVTSTSRPTQHTLHPRLSCKKAFHTTTWHHARKEPLRLRIKRYESSRDPRDTWKADSTTAEPKHDDVFKALADAVPQSPLAKPFSALKEQEFVLRYRSAGSLMVEAAIPEEDLHQVQSFRRTQGARIEAQYDVVSTVDGQKLVSVLLSGTREEVRSAWSVLCSRRNSVPIPDDVTTFLVRPSETLLPLESVLRIKAANGNRKLELSVLEYQWMRFVAAHDLERIARDTKAQIEVTQPSMRPLDPASALTRLARSFLISGQAASVSKAYGQIYATIKFAIPANDNKKTKSEPEAEVEKAPSVEEPVVTRWFEFSGLSRHERHRNFLHELESNLEELRRKVGCQSLQVTGGQGSLKAQGTPSQLNILQKTLVDRVARICEKLGATVPGTRMLKNRPAHRAPKPADQDNDERLVEGTRTALRALTHPVVVVTSRMPGRGDKFERMRTARAVTVSSFNTVTLHPRPIISFNLKKPSSTWDAICESKWLRVHLIAGTPRGAAIASVFTQPYKQAHDGTRRLFHMKVLTKVREGASPPNMYSPYGDVLATLNANLREHHCVDVGDHVIVVAEVEHLETVLKPDGTPWMTDISALSYSNGSYSSGSAVIEPQKLPEMGPEEDLAKEFFDTRASIEADSDQASPDPLALGRAPDSPVDVYRPVAKSADTEVAPAPERAKDRPEEMVNDPIYSALLAAKDSDVKFSPSQQDSKKSPSSRSAVSPSRHDSNKSPSSRSAVSPSRQDSKKSPSSRSAVSPSRQDSKKSPSSRSAVSPSRHDSNKSPSSRSADNSGALWGPKDVTREESERLAENAAPRASPSRAPRIERGRQGSKNGGPERPYSTFARSRACVYPSRRTFSSMQAVRSAPEHTSVHVDPAARNMTVADFFGVPDEGPAHRPQVDGLIRADKTAHLAERRLAKNPDLPEEEKLRLQHHIQVTNRKMSKKLAWNAAIDLRVMLDKGKVNLQRAQFLESAIEKGQMTLLEDARRVRELLNQGKIDLEKFNAIKKSLEETSEVLTTEAMRLRQVVDEEGDYFENAANDEEAGFDGFKGNR